MISIDVRFPYVLQKEVVVEDFNNSSLLFLCNKGRMIEINEMARRVLDLMNGKRDLLDITKIIVHERNIEEQNVQRDIRKLLSELIIQEAVKNPKKKFKNRRNTMVKILKYSAKSDVSLREESDGALLFNANNDTLKILNPVGLLIWRFISSRSRTKTEIVAHLKGICDEVPINQVDADVEMFIEDLMFREFIKEEIDE